MVSKTPSPPALYPHLSSTSLALGWHRRQCSHFRIFPTHSQRARPPHKLYTARPRGGDRWVLSCMRRSSSGLFIQVGFGLGAKLCADLSRAVVPCRMRSMQLMHILEG
ncbi:hypothetical protein C8F04DRAFT_1407795, partial [Mycena alexandri]